MIEFHGCCHDRFPQGKLKRSPLLCTCTCSMHDGLKFSLRTRIGEQSFDGYEMRYTHVETILKRCWLATCQCVLSVSFPTWGAPGCCSRTNLQHLHASLSLARARQTRQKLKTSHSDCNSDKLSVIYQFFEAVFNRFICSLCCGSLTLLSSCTSIDEPLFMQRKKTVSRSWIACELKYFESLTYHHWRQHANCLSSWKRVCHVLCDKCAESTLPVNTFIQKRNNTFRFWVLVYHYCT